MASSPSNLHFGHYMAALENATVLKINLILANIPLTTGAVHDRWQNTLNEMLENCRQQSSQKIMHHNALRGQLQ